MIKVLVPSMPTADDLLPYLREMDESKVYVKGGALVKRLEHELSVLTGSPCTAVANGTVSLELALRAMGLPPGSGVLTPAVTFVATGQAIVNAGLVPVLTDVDSNRWQLDAGHARLVCEADRSIRCALPVAAFGHAVETEPWEHFSYETNLPVLIDAAGAIYDQRSSPYPDLVVSYSLNATKALGAGEGGVVATCDLLLLERVASLANFGPRGTNARMSEYHAAVALASLRLAPGWRGCIGSLYAELLPRDRLAIVGGHQSRRTLFPVLLPKHCNAQAVHLTLASAGIETKAWYRPYLDERDEFLNCPKFGPMPNTNLLRQRLLGLPYHAFLAEDDVATVCTNLEKAIA